MIKVISLDRLREAINLLKAVNYTVTLTPVWTATGDYFTQEVALTGIKETDTPFIDLVTDTTNYKTASEAWGKVFKVETLDNKLKFYATEKTATSVSLKVKVVR